MSMQQILTFIPYHGLVGLNKCAKKSFGGKNFNDKIGSVGKLFLFVIADDAPFKVHNKTHHKIFVIFPNNLFFSVFVSADMTVCAHTTTIPSRSFFFFMAKTDCIFIWLGLNGILNVEFLFCGSDAIVNG